MHLIKTKELNERIIEECNEKIEKALELKKWDEDCFKVISQALDNLAIIDKIEKNEVKENLRMKTRMVDVDLTEFEQLVADVIEEHKENPDIHELVIRCIGETIEDLKVYKHKMYINTLNNLRNMMM